MDYKFEEFSKRLGGELARYPRLITEDLIRYWYVSEKGREDAEIEKPYRVLLEGMSEGKSFKNDKSRADLYLKNDNCVIEFKYHKKMLNSTLCRTDCFGSVFGNLNRLSLLKNIKRLLIYVFDGEMYQYYDKEEKCTELLQEKGEFFAKDILKRCGGTKSFEGKAFGAFEENYKEKIGDYKVKIIYAKNYDKSIYLRVYEIV